MTSRRRHLVNFLPPEIDSFSCFSCLSRSSTKAICRQSRRQRVFVRDQPHWRISGSKSMCRLRLNYRNDAVIIISRNIMCHSSRDLWDIDDESIQNQENRLSLILVRMLYRKANEWVVLYCNTNDRSSANVFLVFCNFLDCIAKCRPIACSEIRSEKWYFILVCIFAKTTTFIFWMMSKGDVPFL